MATGNVDGSHGTFEMLRRPDTIAVVAIDDDGKIIACHEEQPGGVLRQNHIIAGRVNAEDATVLAAAKRETEGGWLPFQKLAFTRSASAEISRWSGLFMPLLHGAKMERCLFVMMQEKIIEGRADYLAVRDNNAHWSPKLEEFSSTEELMSYIQSQNT